MAGHLGLRLNGLHDGGGFFPNLCGLAARSVNRCPRLRYDYGVTVSDGHVQLLLQDLHSDVGAFRGASLGRPGRIALLGGHGHGVDVLRGVPRSGDNSTTSCLVCCAVGQGPDERERR